MRWWRPSGTANGGAVRDAACARVSVLKGMLRETVDGFADDLGGSPRLLMGHPTEHEKLVAESKGSGGDSTVEEEHGRPDWS
jgi:hypothetical protein